MIGQFLAFPFALAARQPVSSVAFVLLTLAAFFGVDAAFAEMGFDPLAGDPFGPGNGRFYQVVTSLMANFVAAFPMAMALRDLQYRSHRASLADGVSLLALGVWFGVAVALPFLVVGFLLAGGLGVLTPANYGPIVVGVAVTIVALAFLYVCVRLAMAGPQTLIDGRIKLYRTWGLTRGKFWFVLGMSALAILVAFVIALVFYLPVLLVPWPGPITRGSDAFQPLTALHLVSTELAFILATAYFSAAQAFLFSKVEMAATERRSTNANAGV